MTEDVLKQILEGIRQLTEKYANLEKEVQELKNTNPSTSRQGAEILSGEAVIHTLKNIESERSQDEMKKRESYDHMLSEVAELAIEDFRQNPPKRRA